MASIFSSFSAAAGRNHHHRQGRQRQRMAWVAAVTVAILLLVVGSCLIAWSLTAANDNNNNNNQNDLAGVQGESTTLSPSPAPSTAPKASAGTGSAEESSPTTAPSKATTKRPSSEKDSPTTRPTLSPGTAASIERTTSKGPTSAAPAADVRSTTPTGKPSDVIECLRSIAGLDVLVTADDDAAEYNAARACLVYPASPSFNAATSTRPLAIVQPNDVAGAAAVVKCTAQYPPTTVSARSGAHSFTAQSCRGDIILDLQRLDSFEVNIVPEDGASWVTWGAGMLHGQVYNKLLAQNLVLPGGAELMVGTGGLWLGCGRGPLTQAYGLSCDRLRSIEYIDRAGNIVRAETDNDLFWLARGGGSLFPGIVTKFTAVAATMPTVVYRESCYYPNTAPIVKAAVRTYTAHLDDMNDPDRLMFGALIVERPHVKFEFHCFDCANGTTELQRVLQLKEDLLGDVEQDVVSDGEATTVAMCEAKEYGYADYLLQSTMWDTYDTTDDFERRSQWPEWKDYWGRELAGSGYNGGILVPDNWSFTAELMDDIVTYTQTLPGNAADRTFLDYFSIYPLKGRGSGNVAPTATAFGGRTSQAIIHYKKDKVDDNAILHKQHMDDFERALVATHGLPCRGFFNYFDEDLVCATNDDEWLTAFYSDPNRVRSIVQAHDPNHVFARLRL